MKIKFLIRFFSSVLCAASLLVAMGCGGEGGGAGSTDAKVSALEAKAAAGDADAAFQAGEIYAEESDKPASMIAALKWFHIAKKLGNEQATLAISTLERTADGDQIMEAMRQADKFSVKTN